MYPFIQGHQKLMTLPTACLYIIDDAEMITQRHRDELRIAYRIATSGRHYRERYGLKFLPPFMIQSIADPAFMLVRELKESDITQLVHEQTRDCDTRESEDIEDTVTALEDCCRALLGAGLQIMLPRAIATQCQQN